MSLRKSAKSLRAAKRNSNGVSGVGLALGEVDSLGLAVGEACSVGEVSAVGEAEGFALSLLVSDSDTVDDTAITKIPMRMAIRCHAFN